MFTNLVSLDLTNICISAGAAGEADQEDLSTEKYLFIKHKILNKVKMK